MEWSKFEFELSQFHPLSIDISFVNDKRHDPCEFRKISISGSEKWINKIENFNKIYFS